MTWNAPSGESADSGREPLLDAVRVLDDEAALGLAEDLREAHGRHGAGSDEIAEHRAGPHGGELIDVADEHEPRRVREGAEEGVRELEIEHRGLVDDERACVDRAPAIAEELALLGVELEQPVERRGVALGGLAHPLRGAAGGRGELRVDARAIEDREDRLHDRRLPHARPARDHEHLVVRGLLDGAPLRGGELDARALLERGDRHLHRGREARSLGFDLRHFRARGEQIADAPRDRHLGLVERRRVHRDVLARGLDDHVLRSRERVGGLLHADLVLFEHARRGGHQREPRGEHVPSRDDVVDRLEDARLRPLRRVRGDPDRSRDLVRGLEPHAPHVEAQAVRLARHDVDRLGPEALVNAGRERGRGAVRLEEDHDRPHRLLRGPVLRDRGRALLAEARHLAHALRI